MSKSDATGTSSEVAVEFGARELKANAAVYHEAKRIVDAASGYDNLEDAMSALKVAYETMERQVENGAGFTPDREMGFGSDNAAVIAESILGRRNTVGATRKAFNAMGK